MFVKLGFAHNEAKHGDIYECQDALCEKAIEHFEKFLNLWKHADPVIAEVEDTRKRLAGLKS